MTPFLLHSSNSKQHTYITINMPLIHFSPFYNLLPYANSMSLGMM